MTEPPSNSFKIAAADHQAGHLEAAAAGYARILQFNPEHLEAITNLAVLLRDRGQITDAIPLFERALALRPGMTEARYVLALCFMQVGEKEQARLHFTAAAKASPSDSRPIVGLAALALNEGDADIALGHTDAALARNLDDADAWNLKGAACKELARFAEARNAYDKALDRQPDHAEARYNRGALKLLLGDMPKGWDDYACRWQGDDRQSPGADLGVPLWDGGPLAGGQLLVVAEQGFGDTLQCLRYLPLLRERGMEVAICCRPELRRLVAAIPEVARVWCPGEPGPNGDAYLPMMELPRIFQTSETNIPAADGYLRAGPVDRPVDGPVDGISVPDQRNIGLVWAGSPTHENDARRSVPLGALRALLDAPNCRFFSLQVGARSADLDAQNMAQDIEDLAPEIKDFADTAAFISAMDLIISVDTAAVHLAGALGTPTWVMLSFVPDWRWQLTRTDSPWYGCLRLFRQSEPGNWRGVINDIRRALPH